MGVVAAGVLVLTGGTATAHDKEFHSSVHLDPRSGPPVIISPGPEGPVLMSDPPNGDFPALPYKAYGWVDGNQRCIPDRPVMLLHINPAGERRVLDRARTSKSGHFGLAGDPGEWGERDVFRVRAPRHRVGPVNQRHRHICAAAQEQVQGGGVVIN